MVCETKRRVSLSKPCAAWSITGRLAQIPSDIRKPLSTRSLKHREQRIYKTLALARRHCKQHLANGAINVSSTGGQALTVHEVVAINHPAKGDCAAAG